MPSYAILCHAVPDNAMLCYVILCCTMLGYAMPCNAVLYHAVLCNAMLCCTMLHYAMLCCDGARLRDSLLPRGEISRGTRPWPEEITVCRAVDRGAARAKSLPGEISLQGGRTQQELTRKRSLHGSQTEQELTRMRSL